MGNLENQMASHARGRTSPLCDGRFSWRRQSLFPNVHTLLNILATLPVSTAAAEWSFSTQKRAKTYLRNRTAESRLNGLALMPIHRKEVSVDEVIALFMGKPRRTKIAAWTALFGQATCSFFFLLHWLLLYFEAIRNAILQHCLLWKGVLASAYFVSCKHPCFGSLLFNKNLFPNMSVFCLGISVIKWITLFSLSCCWDREWEVGKRKRPTIFLHFTHIFVNGWLIPLHSLFLSLLFVTDSVWDFLVDIIWLEIILSGAHALALLLCQKLAFHLGWTRLLCCILLCSRVLVIIPGHLFFLFLPWKEFLSNT